ncbi:exonuclease 1 isoform X2 [Hyalella azteca]|uniref:Exonuclease 1 n=1 Tax=Hyalella azteca TaxID=294128 RepID=A0A8B7NCR7_HYAAZ|nr:exonuclease 1 isoform X2 [Hyalella azteca]
MGITGLLPFVKKASRPCFLHEFAGKVAAVDAYCWLHKGAFSCADKLGRGEDTDGYVVYVMKLVRLLVSHHIKPIMVFDGCNLPSKAGTEAERRESRAKNRALAKEMLREGRVREAREFFQRCVDVTSKMARAVMKACRELNVDCIVAPYEADAQLAYLANEGFADVVITEDSDLLVFGCEKVIFKMDSLGGGILVEQEKLHVALGLPPDRFSLDLFRNMCILSGCDYLPSLPGIGLVKACKFFSLTSNTDVFNVLCKLPAYLKMPQLEVTLEYRSSFVKAVNTFLYQLVFCPRQRVLRPLVMYQDGSDCSDHPYAGAFIGNEKAFAIALGNVDLQSKQIVDKFHPDQQKAGHMMSLKKKKDVIVENISIWDPDYDKSIFHERYLAKTDKKSEAFGSHSAFTANEARKRGRTANRKEVCGNSGKSEKTAKTVKVLDIENIFTKRKREDSKCDARESDSAKETSDLLSLYGYARRKSPKKMRFSSPSGNALTHLNPPTCKDTVELKSVLYFNSIEDIENTATPRKIFSTSNETEKTDEMCESPIFIENSANETSTVCTGEMTDEHSQQMVEGTENDSSSKPNLFCPNEQHSRLLNPFASGNKKIIIKSRYFRPSEKSATSDDSKKDLGSLLRKSIQETGERLSKQVTISHNNPVLTAQQPKNCVLHKKDVEIEAKPSKMIQNLECEFKSEIFANTESENIDKSNSESQDLHVSHQDTQVAKSKAEESLPESQAINSASQEIPPESQEVTLESREINPASQEITPTFLEIYPSSQEITPASQEICPASQEITPASQEITSASSQKFDGQLAAVSQRSSSFNDSNDRESFGFTPQTNSCIDSSQDEEECIRMMKTYSNILDSQATSSSVGDTLSQDIDVCTQLSEENISAPSTVEETSRSECQEKSPQFVRKNITRNLQLSSNSIDKSLFGTQQPLLNICNESRVKSGHESDTHPSSSLILAPIDNTTQRNASSDVAPSGTSPYFFKAHTPNLSSCRRPGLSRPPSKTKSLGSSAKSGRQLNLRDMFAARQ